MSDETSLRKAVEQDPGTDAFIELAEILSEDRRGEAREVCCRGITANPKSFRGRLLLAKLFYLDRMPEFSVRELVELYRLSRSEAVWKLIEAFGPFAAPYLEVKAQQQSGKAVPNADESVVSEIDLDSEFIDALDEIEDFRR